MLTMILAILALVFAVLSLLSVPSKVSWAALGVLCLSLAMLLPRVGVS
jgi:hypothetical protein